MLAAQSRKRTLEEEKPQEEDEEEVQVVEVKRAREAEEEEDEDWEVPRDAEGRVLPCVGEMCGCRKNPSGFRRLYSEEKARHRWPEVLAKFEAWNATGRAEALKKAKEQNKSPRSKAAIDSYWPVSCCCNCGGKGYILCDDDDHGEPCENCKCGDCGDSKIYCNDCEAWSDWESEDGEEE